ncbi:MAG TPA: YeeE/YedE thiosulfate transporter family protein, partial [Candidatus Deferrimicrobiaceae bacterium]
MTIDAVRIVLVVLFVGLVSGFVMHRADFCIAGAFRDLFLFRKTFMLRVLLLLVASSMLLFEGARRLGLLPLYPFPLLGAVSPANFGGGLLFGIGMVLAGGCVIGTLYRSGSGNVPAMAAMAGLVLGSGLYAEIHPAWSTF